MEQTNLDQLPRKLWNSRTQLQLFENLYTILK